MEKNLKDIMMFLHLVKPFLGLSSSTTTANYISKNYKFCIKRIVQGGFVEVAIWGR
jgi:hypothetical protein